MKGNGRCCHISLLNLRSHTHNSQLKREALDDLKAAANAPANLQIVPIHIRDSVCVKTFVDFFSSYGFISVLLFQQLEATIQALGPLPAASGDKAS